MEKSPKRGLRLANESVAVRRNQALIRASSTKGVFGLSFPKHIHFLHRVVLSCQFLFRNWTA